MITRTRQRLDSDADGFTLVELLLVIVILGILSAVVVFSVAGIDDRGEQSACRTDAQTIRTAQEAHFAKVRGYGSEAQLVSAGFLSRESSYHDVTLNSPTQYTIVAADGRCGTVGQPI